MEELKVYTIDDMNSIVEANKDNFCINFNLEQYRKIHPQISLNK
jgi:hypothetical protein